MLVAEVGKLTPFERFCYWIRERHAIYLRRQKGLPKPWTDDVVLQNYFFTNPFRENDKVTVWFRENIREPLRDDPAVLFATICFRWFNWPATGEQLLKYPSKSSKYGALTDWNLPSVLSRLHGLKEHGAQIFTGAFNISNSGSTKSKIDRVCEDYIQPAWEQRQHFLDRWYDGIPMEGMHDALMTLPGLGGSGFMAYEVVCDLRYTYLLRNAPDKLTWSNPGPGAKRGINRIRGRDLGASVKLKEWREWSSQLLLDTTRKLKLLLEAREIEHSLCEYDKYERARLADGHMKRRYQGV